MTFIEAIIEMRHGKNQYMWIRPLSWKGQRAAFMQDSAGIKGTNLVFVPSGNPHPPCAFPPIGDLLSQWEVVKPDDVNLGR